MQRRTFMQALSGLFAGLLIRVEPVKAAVKRRIVAFSPLARWKHVAPTPIEDVDPQDAVVVATMLRPARSHTLVTREGYRAAMNEATGRTVSDEELWKNRESWADRQDPELKWTAEDFAAAERKLRLAKRSNETYDEWYARIGQ